MGTEYPWERPLGARPQADGLTEFRVWAPRADVVAVTVAGKNPDAFAALGNDRHFLVSSELVLLFN